MTGNSVPNSFVKRLSIRIDIIRPHFSGDSSMKISSFVTLIPALALIIGASETTAQQPQPAAQATGQRGQRGQGERGQQPPRPTVVRPKDQRVPPPFSMDMVRPVAMPDNVWMSELTILEMRDLV